MAVSPQALARRGWHQDRAFLGSERRTPLAWRRMI